MSVMRACVSEGRKKVSNSVSKRKGLDVSDGREGKKMKRGNKAI